MWHSITKYHKSYFFILVIETGVGEFIEITDCTYSGDTLIYNCNVARNGFTIWRRSVFECSSTESSILLHHLSFERSGTIGFCNGGAIVGCSLWINMDNTSQLTVNLTASSSNLIGKELSVFIEMLMVWKQLLAQ